MMTLGAKLSRHKQRTNSKAKIFPRQAIRNNPIRNDGCPTRKRRQTDGQQARGLGSQGATTAGDSRHHASGPWPVRCTHPGPHKCLQGSVSSAQSAYVPLPASAAAEPKLKSFVDHLNWEPQLPQRKNKVRHCCLIILLGPVGRLHGAPTPK